MLAALRALPFLEDGFEAILLSQKDASYLACSPDVIVLLNKATLPIFSSAAGFDAAAVYGSDSTLVCATDEIKTLVAASSLVQSIALSTSGSIQCERGNAQFQTYVPREHMAQIVHQIWCLVSAVWSTLQPPKHRCNYLSHRGAIELL